MSTNGFSTSTADVNANVRRVPIPRVTKHRPRTTDGKTYPVTVTKVEPVVSRTRPLSEAIKAECIDRLGYIPSVTR